MCDLAQRTGHIVVTLATSLDMRIVPDGLWQYARLVALLADLYDGDILDRATTYLKDCDGSPEHATGRLLLRAAERALRKAGDA